MQFPYAVKVFGFGEITVIAHKDGRAVCEHPDLMEPELIPLDDLYYDETREDGKWESIHYGLYFETEKHNFLCFGGSDDEEESKDMLKRFEKTFGVFLEVM